MKSSGCTHFWKLILVCACSILHWQRQALALAPSSPLLLTRSFHSNSFSPNSSFRTLRKNHLLQRRNSQQGDNGEPITPENNNDTPADKLDGSGTQEHRAKMVPEIVALAFPALGGMILDPIMSVVDTACVGQISSLQLASLAPSTSVCTFVFSVFFFLSAATTNLVAANNLPEKANESVLRERIDLNETIVAFATTLAVVFGVLVTLSLLAFTNPLLALAGAGASSASSSATTSVLEQMEMLRVGREYLRIRAIGTPFVFVATVLQGASLGRQDAWTPLKIFAAAGVLNLIGDIALTLKLGWGAKGAAVATVLSQVLATTLFVVRSIRLQRKETSYFSKPGSGVALSLRRMKPSKKKDVQPDSSPPLNIALEFGRVAVTLLLRSIFSLTAYSLLTRSVAPMGALPLAAHQVTLQVFWLLSWVPEPFSVAAQTLVARDRKKAPERVPRLVRVLYAMSAATGLLMAAGTWLALTVESISSALVGDVRVRSLLLTTAPYAALAQCLCCLCYLSDGVCLGLGDIQHLPSILGMATFTLFQFLRGVHTPAGVWVAANIFFVARWVGHLLLSSKLRNYLFARQRESPVPV